MTFRTEDKEEIGQPAASAAPAAVLPVLNIGPDDDIGFTMDDLTGKATFLIMGIFPVSVGTQGSLCPFGRAYGP